MRPIRVFKARLGWFWTCSSCGIGHSSPQWQFCDQQPAALAAALKHCRESGLA